MNSQRPLNDDEKEDYNAARRRPNFKKHVEVYNQEVRESRCKPIFKTRCILIRGPEHDKPE